MKLTDFKVLTFDCYGTLIDWETGILKALQPLLNKIAKLLTADQILEAYARHEAALELQHPQMRYSELLANVHERLAAEWGIETSMTENLQFSASVKDWPAFPDSPAALQYLKKHFKLVILSNVDRESFRHSNDRLEVKFDHIYTAQEIGSYKPDLRNFQYLIAKLSEQSYQKSVILHTAESLFHDHAPANQLGLASAWIHRRHDRKGTGATAPPGTMPGYNFRFNSMAEMAAAHALEMKSNSPANSLPH